VRGATECRVRFVQGIGEACGGNVSVERRDHVEWQENWCGAVLRLIQW
jgi:hypothetical protein